MIQITPPVHLVQAEDIKTVIHAMVQVARSVLVVVEEVMTIALRVTEMAA